MIDTVLPYKRRRKIRNYLVRKNLEVTGVKCPICKNQFKKFKPFGLRTRENANCPSCWSLERHRLLYLFLSKNNLLFNSSKRVNLLHIAPEKSLYNIFKKSENINYSPLDLDPTQYHFLKGPEIIQGNITNLPFENIHFDFILCNHVLEHIPDDAKAMSELLRVMKKGGKGIFLVPIDEKRTETYEDFSITKPEDREKAFGQKDHVRWYGQDYPFRLEKAGFKVSVIDYAKEFSSRKRFKYGIMTDEKIFLVEKKNDL
ncbi:methyltransferase domain-containing protein [Salegentibacter sp. F188]|uniref:Methyltransferase domain-containing protein n=1 Tax=Autumnicola patrickiae TaxID=3075591 RepID=A0ABU3E118_9FLAO|nr:methyltransferase domain-containing protein [Salegentibacter sp. F188]MDT0689384.1 methyltransferase domain-containing protein [Salegentibacter sp. F188]